MTSRKEKEKKKKRGQKRECEEGRDGGEDGGRGGSGAENTPKIVSGEREEEIYFQKQIWLNRPKNKKICLFYIHLFLLFLFCCVLFCFTS